MFCTKYNKIIREFIRFTTLLFILILIVGVFERELITKKVYSDKYLKLPNNVSKLFIGDSHIMCAINDSLINGGFNGSRNSESIFQTYNKLNFILKINPQIKEVYLGFSPHNISAQANSLVLYGDRYFPLLDEESKLIIKNAYSYDLIKKEKNFVKNIFIKAKHVLTYYFLQTKYYIGLIYNLNDFFNLATGTIYSHPIFTLPHYSNNVNLNENSINTILKRHYDYNCNGSDLMYKYLLKCDSVCRESKVKLTLLNTPLHSKYFHKIPKCYLDKYNNTTSILKANFNIHFLNLFNLISEDKYFGDGDHLNSMGRDVFSRKLNQIINSNAI